MTWKNCVTLVQSSNDNSEYNFTCSMSWGEGSGVHLTCFLFPVSVLQTKQVTGDNDLQCLFLEISNCSIHPKIRLSGVIHSGKVNLTSSYLENKIPHVLKRGRF